MRKFLIGLIAVAVLGVAGYFGGEFYIRHRVTSDVDAAFAQIRASGARATHGKIAFDLIRRTLTVEDIAVQSDAKPPVDVKIGRFTARGIELMPPPGRFVAERVEIADIAATGTLAIQGGLKLDYSMPRLDIVGYSGPAAVNRPFDPNSPIALWRFAFEQFAAVSAASITVPSTSATMTPLDAALAKQIGQTTYEYTGLAVRDVRAGKIASATIARLTSTAKFVAPNGTVETVASEMTDMTALDSDMAATLAMLDPARAKDDNYYRAYRQITAGKYTLDIGSAAKISLDSFTIDDLSLKPSKLQIAEIMSMMEAIPTPGTLPATAQDRARLEQTISRLAGIYEGIGIGKLEMRGGVLTMPQGPVKIDAIRLADMKDGRIGEVSIADFEGSMTPGAPTRVGRFALKGFDFVSTIRVATQGLASGQPPTPELIAAMVRLLEGIELKGFTAPYQSSTQLVKIDLIDIGWGSYVGPIPGKIRATVKMSGPVSARDPDPFKMLAAAGATTASISADFGLAWDEATRAITLAPGTAEIGDVGSLAVRASITNVPREAFSLDPFQIMVGTAAAEAGPVEIVVRDTGGLDLTIAQEARRQNVSREEARKTIVDNVRQAVAGLAALGSSDTTAVSDAVARFIETPRGTLTLRVTPKGKVTLMELIESVRTGSMAAAELFQVEATTSQ